MFFCLIYIYILPSRNKNLYTHGSSSFFWLEPHTHLVQGCRISASATLQNGTCSAGPGRVLCAEGKALCFPHLFKKLKVPFWLNQRVNNCCFGFLPLFWGADCRAAAAVLHGSCPDYLRLLPHILKLERVPWIKALSTDVVKTSPLQSCINGSLLILLYSLVIVSFWYFLLTFCPWSFITCYLPF